jgi:hypothetical protein
MSFFESLFGNIFGFGAKPKKSKVVRRKKRVSSKRRPTRAMIRDRNDRSIRSPGRKAPKDSATKHKVGKRKKGIDGKMYIVIKTSKSKRWKRV